ncbi:MAG: M61 family metallopeptidase [Candidatus Aminicenantales bacterium]
MEKPHTHYFRVSLEIEGYRSESINLKLPNWTPGYYRIMDYARQLINFQAYDEKGEPLPWEKTAKNVWHIKTSKAKRVIVNYDVYAFNISVAESFLDDSRAYIVPASLFVHPEGFLQNPVKLKILPPDSLSHVFTGLEPVAGEPNTYLASDFDILYDCPLYLGNPEVLSFDVNGVPHVMAAEDLGQINRQKLVADLKKLLR